MKFLTEEELTNLSFIEFFIYSERVFKEINCAKKHNNYQLFTACKEQLPIIKQEMIKRNIE